MDYGFQGPTDILAEELPPILRKPAELIRKARDAGALDWTEVLLFLAEDTAMQESQKYDLHVQLTDIAESPIHSPELLEKSAATVKDYANARNKQLLEWKLADAMRKGLPTEDLHRQLADISNAKPSANTDSFIFPAYYDGTRFLLDTGKDFVPMDSRSIRAHIKKRGLNDPDSIICDLQTERFIKYCGPLAGRQRGVYESNGDLLLASTSPKIIRSHPGEFPIIRKFITDLLGGDEHAETQQDSFLGWLHIARKAMLEGKRRPGQALVLAGKVACGKTQLIKKIIVPAMGGREAKPYKFLSGRTGFNADLLSAEVLVIDDEASSTRLEVRRALGDGIKTAAFTSSVRIEGKFKGGFDFDPLWRIVIAVNDQPESLMVLPPLSDDLSDKFIILKCQKALEFSDEEFESWNRKVSDEMPAFLHAVESFEIESSNSDGRCGVKSFYHPEVIAAISEISPQNQLMSLIKALEAGGGIQLPWEGTASSLKALLTSQSSPIRLDADRLLGNWIPACGVYLGRLVGEGIEKLPLRDGDQRWKIA
jgi:hypothetical protein